LAKEENSLEDGDYSMKTRSGYFHIASLFLIARLILFISTPLETITGYGDFWNFFQQAELGWPFIDYWTEFPPLFPFIARMIYVLTSGRESAFYYSLAITISFFQAGCVYLIGKLETRLYPDSKFFPRTIIYAFLTSGLFYSWSYFDPLAVYFLLLALSMLVDKKSLPANGALALGVLVKWFPFLVLPIIWKRFEWKTALRNTLVVLAVVVVVWGGLYLINGEMTKASLFSQANKGSWETIWALIDGNILTGNFSSEINRIIPDTAEIQTGSRSVISPILSLIILGGLGFYLLISAELGDDLGFIAFVGVALVIFFFWSPGYSPQWVLYLLPFALLALPISEGTLFAVVYLLVNLLEWPILLSRGYFWSLYYLIPARTLLMMLLGLRLYQSSKGFLIIKKRREISEI